MALYDYTLLILVYELGLAKQDLWGLVTESLCILASCPFAKMISQCNGRIILAKGKLATIYYDYAPRQGPKDPVLPTLAYTAHWLVCFNHRGMHNSPDAQSKFIETFIRIKFIYSEKATQF